MRKPNQKGTSIISRERARRLLTVAGAITAIFCALGVAAWAVPAAWSFRGYVAVGGEWGAVGWAAFFGWRLGVVGCAVALRKGRKRFARLRHLPAVQPVAERNLREAG